MPTTLQWRDRGALVVTVEAGKKGLSESDICYRFISTAVTNAGWATNQWRREFGFTDGKIIVRGKLVARDKR